MKVRCHLTASPAESLACAQPCQPSSRARSLPVGRGGPHAEVWPSTIVIPTTAVKYITSMTTLAHMVASVLGYMSVEVGVMVGKRSKHYGCGTSRTAVRLVYSHRWR